MAWVSLPKRSLGCQTPGVSLVNTKGEILQPKPRRILFPICLQKIFFASRKVPFPEPRPRTRGTRRVFRTLDFRLRHIFVLHTDPLKKVICVIEMIQNYGVVFLPTFSHSVFGEHCGLRAGRALSLLMIRSAGSTLNFLLHVKCSQFYIATRGRLDLLQPERKKASRGFEPRSLDSESRVLTVTPRGHMSWK